MLPGVLHLLLSPLTVFKNDRCTRYLLRQIADVNSLQIPYNGLCYTNCSLMYNANGQTIGHYVFCA